MTVDPEGDTTIPIACTPTDAELARRGEELAASLFTAVEAIDELVDGYAFRFPADSAWLPRLTEFVGAERQCCPFLRFEVICEPGPGPLWLRLRGAEEVKAFIETTCCSRISLARRRDSVDSRAVPR